MKHLKLFENYEDKLYKIVDDDLFLKFKSEHIFEKISNSELKIIQGIFSFTYQRAKLGQIEVIEKELLDLIYSDQECIPNIIYKFSDNYWIIEIGHIRSKNDYIICDTIDGIIEYRNSDDYDG